MNYSVTQYGLKELYNEMVPTQAPPSPTQFDMNGIVPRISALILIPTPSSSSSLQKLTAHLQFFSFSSYIPKRGPWTLNDLRRWVRKTRISTTNINLVR